MLYYDTKPCPVQGHMYAMGGNDGATSLESCERYDPHLNKWILIAPMNKRRAGAGVAELNGKLYMIGEGCWGLMGLL